MSKSRRVTIFLTLLVTHYLAFQAGQTVLFYRRPTTASASPLPQAPVRKYGVNQVLQFSEHRLDFGQLQGDRPRNQGVELRNPSSEPVQIRRVRSSCGCVSTVVEPMLVPPGGRAQMVVVVNPKLAAADMAVSLSVEYEGKNEIDRLMVSAHKPPEAAR